MNHARVSAEMSRRPLKSSFLRLFPRYSSSSLTSCRHHWNTTRVAEALQHRITNQRYQHDYPRISKRSESDKGWGRAFARENGQLRRKENSRKSFPLFPGLTFFFFLLFGTSENLDVNAARERMELREKLRTAKTSPSGMHFVVSCGVEALFSPSCSHRTL